MNWRRTTGIVISRTGQAERSVGFLDGALVPAQVESDPEAPDSVLVTVAVDGADRVAIVGPEGHGIVAGPPLQELAEAIAADVRGEVNFPGAVADDLDRTEQGPDPFEQHLDVDAAYAPDRAVVFSRMGPAGVIELATAVDQQVFAREHLDGQLVLITEGPSLTSVEWPDALVPALILEQGAAFPSGTMIIAAGRAHVHTWDVQVARTPDGVEEVAAFIDATLGIGAFVRELMRIFPAVEPTGVRAALTGPGAGPAALIEALGLPTDTGGFLSHERAAEELPGLTPVDPDTLVETVRRAMSGAVSGATVTMSVTAEAMRQRAEAMRLRAETVFDAAETFTEEVVLPARQSWVTPSLAVAESVLGALAIRRARRGGALGVISGVIGSALLADAVVNLTIAASALLRRERS